MHSVTNERDKLLPAKNVPTQLANILIFLKAGADSCSKGHNSSGYTLGLVNNNTAPHRKQNKEDWGIIFLLFRKKIVLSFLQIGLL